MHKNIAAEKLIKFHILQSRVQRKIADVSSKTFKKFTDHFIIELQNCIVKENNISPSWRQYNVVVSHYNFITQNILPKYFGCIILTKSFLLWTKGILFVKTNSDICSLQKHFRLNLVKSNLQNYSGQLFTTYCQAPGPGPGLCLVLPWFG